MQKSIWNEGVALPTFPALRGDIKTDVLIIGGGICGILCAYLLKEAGVDCALVEAGGLAQGTTSNTTAKITSLHGLVYSEFLAKMGKENTKKYFDINQFAIHKYEELARNFPCDFENLSAFTYSTDNVRKIEKEVFALKTLGAEVEFHKKTPLPVKVAGAVELKNQAQFHPLKLLSHLVKGLNIYENTTVKVLTPNKALCHKGSIAFQKAIVATHFPFLNKHGGYFLKLYQHRSYVIALENAQNVGGMYVDAASDGLSFRNSNGLLLLGGGGGRTGKSCGNWQELMRVKTLYYPDATVKTKWATQDCMSLDKIPYIGQYGKNTSNLYVATGFHKWGMTSSMVAAVLLCDLVRGRKNQYADIFSPCRSILTPQLFVNGFESVINLLTPTKKRCPHLGCALKWNPAEHSWDCPCHGSRFDTAGKLLCNPAMTDLRNLS